ncbi:MAG: AAA family ATPase [Victivallales bacterium]|nr:AAA family ATPase [Victivallales bacterium]
MFVGREKELASLALLLEKGTSSIVACRGRRRIGKSTLIKEFARRNDLKLINIDGLPLHRKQTNRDQLINFALKLAKCTGHEAGVPQNWFQAFGMLSDAIDDSARTLVLLDEISWMGHYDDDFAGYLKSAWDDELKEHDNVILVICGSVSSWIRKNILDNAGFGGRFSRDIVLGELTPAECTKFWGERATRLAVREIIDVLSVTGGVPRYLEDVNPALSADENIKRLFFHHDGPLFKDFKAMFSEIFGDGAVQKGQILRCLSEKAMTLSEIAEELDVERGGALSESLKDLCEAGFLAADNGCNPETGRLSKEIRYRIRDNYTRFYLKYVEPEEANIRNGQYEFISLSMLPGWESVMGLAFENLVVNHAMTLMEAFHLGGIPILSVAPYKRRARKDGTGGVQIDLLVQARKAVCIVEVKRQKQIGEEVEREVAEKVSRLKIQKGISIRTALVYDGELADVVRGNSYFDAIVSSRELLKLDG